ncbi:MAG: aminotransferase class III-fold pyridoxal phosphate-dependent enzyme, partial [Candidatus Eremiobacteraeota bacterium]|nr:aminotransferase class III-fold pyridoxal phosphate-dependent enzyme [Candidatus Eremiobacteraeota bacterium]
LEAIKRQVDDLCLTLPNAVYPAKRELAERLLELAPPGFDRVFFTLGGAEANENAIKMARAVTGRHKTISRYRSYHGATMGALSLSGDYRRPPFEPAMAGAVHCLDCYCDRCPFGQTYPGCKLECAQHIGQVLELDGPGTFAAVFLEPIPGANGVMVPPPGYWSTIRQACDAHGTLLVADEVLTGFGRTGRWLGIEHEGVIPDMITCAKGLTGGYATLGAVLVHERVSRHFDDKPLLAGLTGYSHPIACAAALEALHIYHDEGLIVRAAALEEPLLTRLDELRSSHSRLRFVRGRGLLAALEFEADAAFMEELRKRLLARRIYVHVKVATQMLVLSPPLCIEKNDLLAGIEVIDQVLAELS